MSEHTVGPAIVPREVVVAGGRVIAGCTGFRVASEHMRLVEIEVDPSLADHPTTLERKARTGHANRETVRERVIGFTSALGAVTVPEHEIQSITPPLEPGDLVT